MNNSHLTINSINTSKFEFAHGRKPQPTQRGFWYFEVKCLSGKTVDSLYVGTYTEARSQLLADVRNSVVWAHENVVSLSVLP